MRRKTRRFPLAAFAACVATVSLTSCRFTSVKNEPVTLSAVRDATVVSGGSQHAAVEGAHLRKGDRVVTGSAGAATLEVRGRKVTLGPSTDVTIPDGATVKLRLGGLLVDHRHGPGVTVYAGDTVVDDLGTGALRVERSLSVLVAGLSTGARVRTVTGPRLRLQELYQVGVAGRALPRIGAPLHLRDDDWERRVIADVVEDDVRLNDLARGIANGETLLAEAIGRAAGDDDTSRTELARRAQALRNAGGSWGVVARLIRTSAVDAASALADVLHPDLPTNGPSPSPGSSTPSGPSPTPQPSGSPTSGHPTHRPPTHTPSPEPTTESPSSPSIVDTLESAIPTPPVGPLSIPVR